VPSLLAQTCTASTCHSASNKAQGLDLQSPDVAARLVGVPATGGPGALIDPSAPAKSVLYEKLSASPPFGARMPLGAAPLDAPTLACVLAWITQVADATGPDAASAGAGTGASSPDAASDDGGDE
jgi:predicted CxxxxCH...CXXCH cytochrome family protein